MYAISLATRLDIPAILQLQADNQADRGGFLSTSFSPVWFERVIDETAIIVAKQDQRLAGYLVCSSRSATEHLQLAQAKYRAYPGAAPDAYNSGPLCISAEDRGRDLASKLFSAQRACFGNREGVAFVRRDNGGSRAVHIRSGFTEVAAFTHDGVDYLVLTNLSQS